MRPPSPRPAWEDAESRQRRGSARYRINPEELPPAYLPDDAPSWMGEPSTPRTKPTPEEPVIPRPASSQRRPRFAQNWPEQESMTEAGTSQGIPGEASRIQNPLTEPGTRSQAHTSDRAPQQHADRVETAAAASRLPASKRAPAAQRQLPQRPRRASRGTQRSPFFILQDPTVRVFLGAIVVLAVGLWIFVTTKDDSLSGAIALRIGANGEPAEWGTPLTILRLPFLASILAVLSAGTALLVAPHDAFASRFTLGMGVVAQVLAWIAACALL